VIGRYAFGTRADTETVIGTDGRASLFKVKLPVRISPEEKEVTIAIAASV
jgi:hypothetical protein